MNRIGSIAPLSREEQIALFHEYRATKRIDIRNLLVESNMRLVIGQATTWRNRVKNPPALEDLVQEGAVGLTKAVERFEPERGFAFSTYAIWWIRQAINDAIQTDRRKLRLPSAASRIQYRLTEAIDAWKRIDPAGNEPTVEELAAVLDEKPENIQIALQSRMPVLSLDQPTWTDGSVQSGSVIDKIPDLDAITPEEQLLRNEMLDIVEQALESLDPRDAVILRLRHGLLTPRSPSEYVISDEEAEALERGEPLT